MHNGYQFGSNQPVRLYTVKLQPQRPERLQQIEPILRDRLGLADRFVLPSLASRMDADLAQLAWWVAQLSNSLMRAIRLPIEFPGLLVGAGRDSGTVQLALTCFDQRCQQPRLNSLSAAAGIIQQLCDCLDNAPEQLEARIVAVQAAVMKKFIEPALKAPQSSLSERTIVASYLAANIPITACAAGSWRVGWGAKSELISGSAIGPDSAIGAQLSDNKAATALLLKQAGLPAATHVVVDSPAAAIQAAAKIGYPVVVKPVNLDRREGVTVGISNEPALLAALAKVNKLGAQQALVEQQAAGCCHRIYVRNGEFQYAVKRHPKSVEGDGQLTIKKLIEKFYRNEQRKAPWLRLKPAPGDVKTEQALAAQGFTLNTILSEQEKAYLRPIQDPEEELWGAGMTVLTEQAHPENILLAETLSRLFGLSSIGVDLITADISQPWQSSGAIVNEVNYSPNMASPIHRAASYLVPLLERQKSQIDRIPVHLYLGPSARPAALAAYQQLMTQQGGCYFVSAEQLYDGSGGDVACAADTLFERVQALLTRPQVTALVVLLEHRRQCQQWLAVGSPVDQFVVVRLATAADQADRNSWQQLADRLTLRPE